MAGTQVLLLEIDERDTVVINDTNQAQYEVSIHWYVSDLKSFTTIVHVDW